MRLIDLIFCFIFPFVWGMNMVALKFAVLEIEALEAILLRFFLVAVFLTPFLRFEKLNLFWLVLTSLTLSSGILFTTLGVQHLDLPILIMTFQLNVPLSSVLAVIFLGDVMHWRRILGTVLAFFGVCIVVFDPASQSSFIGVVYVLIAAFLTATFNISLKKLKADNVMSAIGWSTIISLPLLLFFTLFYTDFSLAKLVHLQYSTWRAIVFSSIFSSLIGYGLWFYLNKKYALSLVAPFALLTPIFGTVASVICFEEVLTNSFFIGAAFTFIGVAIVTIRKPEVVSGVRG
jgi:O-acetylserine/cysteine efflux transporter